MTLMTDRERVERDLEQLEQQSAELKRGFRAWESAAEKIAEELKKVRELHLADEQTIRNLERINTGLREENARLQKLTEASSKFVNALSKLQETGEL